MSRKKKTGRRERRKKGKGERRKKGGRGKVEEGRGEKEARSDETT
jgi:hypothetical protein